MGVTGILGGRFDPPHNGHVALARAAVKAFGLERLVVVVTLCPGHKDAVLDGETRTGMTIMAMADQLDAGDILLQEAVEIGAVVDGHQGLRATSVQKKGSQSEP